MLGTSASASAGTGRGRGPDQRQLIRPSQPLQRASPTDPHLRRISSCTGSTDGRGGPHRRRAPGSRRPQPRRRPVASPVPAAGCRHWVVAWTVPVLESVVPAFAVGLLAGICGTGPGCPLCSRAAMRVRRVHHRHLCRRPLPGDLGTPANGGDAYGVQRQRLRRGRRPVRPQRRLRHGPAAARDMQPGGISTPCVSNGDCTRPLRAVRDPDVRRPRGHLRRRRPVHQRQLR